MIGASTSSCWSCARSLKIVSNLALSWAADLRFFGDMAAPTHTAPTVAFVLSGELRAFTVPEVLHSIRTNAIDALCPNASVCVPDSFVCPTRDGCPPYSFYSRSAVQLRNAGGGTSAKRYAAILRNFTRGNLSVPNSSFVPCANLNVLLPACYSDVAAPSDCAAAWSAVQPRCAIEVRNAGRTSAAARLLNETFSTSNASTTGNVGAINSWRCYLRVVEHERRRGGHKYDWIVRLRFDVAFYEPLPTLGAFAARGRGVFVADNHERTFADHFGLVAREHAEVYFGASRMRCCTSLSRCLTRIVGAYFLPHNPEQALQASLFAASVPVYFGYVPWILVRQIGRGGDVAANCYVHKECCAPHGKQRAFGSSCWPPCPPLQERLDRCTALFGASRSCTHLGSSPSGVEKMTRTQVPGKDFNKVNLCELVPSSRRNRTGTSKV